MDFEKKIVEVNLKYGAVLEGLSFMLPFGSCDRLLPFPKREIEQALVAQALFHKEKKDKKALGTTIDAYKALSYFLPYKKYRLIKDVFVSRERMKAMQKEKFRTQVTTIYNDIESDIEKRIKKLKNMLGRRGKRQ